MMNKPEIKLTLVATLHEPIDATVLAAVLHANPGLPMGPWAATAFEIRICNAVRGGACIEIYRREFVAPEMAEHRAHAAMYAAGVPYNVDGSDVPASPNPNAGYTGARA